ncbi:MAG: PQQ-dependent sugar dehydrogenase [Wenzhouxiangella sp.]
MRTLCLLSPLFALLLATAIPPTTAASAEPFRVEVLAEGLEHPWSMVWLDDERILIAERAGRLRLFEHGRLHEQALSGVPDSFVSGQGGLQDLVLHPDFADNGWIYLSLAQGDARANATRVVRGRVEDMAWIDNETIFTARPTKATAVHYGARMAFMPDGTLLVSIGDGFNLREEAQNLNSHIGSIVRITDDGQVPADNPFIDRPDALPEIFSYGHRNPQGLIVDAETGLIWSHEHGPRGGDELNLIRAGANYGWPVATHGIDYSGARISPFTSRPGMVDPLIVWTPAVAPAGMIQYLGDMFPDWHGDLLITNLVERSLRRVRIDGERVLADEVLPLNIDRRLRDVRVGPNGAIYLLTDASNGALLRVTRAD